MLPEFRSGDSADWVSTGVKLLCNSDRKDVRQHPREGEHNAAGIIFLKSKPAGGKSHISLADHEVETGTTNAADLCLCTLSIALAYRGKVKAHDPATQQIHGT